MKNDQEYILCAAIRRLERRKVVRNPYYEGKNDILDIEIGYRHHDIMIRFQGEVSRKPDDQGFYTSKGRFVSREEGLRIARESGQCGENTSNPLWGLFSEDLY